MERKIFVLNKGGHRFDNTDYGFRKMRRRMMMEFTKISRGCIGHVADFFDEVRDMEIGDERFVTDSEYLIYSSESLKSFESKLNYWDDFAERKECETAAPSYFHMYVIRKTAKHYVVRPLDYECIY